MAKTCYHSELFKLSPIQVTVKSEVKQSKYSKPNDPKPPYVMLLIEGVERTYNCENEACAAFFQGKNGQTFTLVAEGSGPDARITFVGQTGFGKTAPVQQPAPVAAHVQEPVTPATQPIRTASGPAEQAGKPNTQSGPTGEQSLKMARVFCARRLSLYKIASKAALLFKEEFDHSDAAKHLGVKMSDDQFWKIVAGLKMSMEAEGLAMRKGFADALPTNLSFADLSIIPPKGAAIGTVAPPQQTPPPAPKCVKCGAEGVALTNGLCVPCSMPISEDDIPF